MPSPGERERTGPKGQYSCDFCRTRKLRCDRPLPCTSCKSRGKTCHFGPGPTVTTRRGHRTSLASSTTASTRESLPQQTPSTISSLPLPSPHLAPAPQSDLLAEIHALRQLTHDLEKRVTQSTTDQLRHAQLNNETALSSSISPPSDSELTLQSGSGNVGEVVAHLQRVSMGQSSLEPIYADDMIFKIECIRLIPQAPTYSAQLGRFTPCVWLPRHTETKMLVESYIADISYIQHVVHRPSLQATINETYQQIIGNEPVKPGHLVLMLSIIACATHVWTPREANNEHPLFLSSAQANAQTPLWIKATNAVLSATQNNVPPTLETIQGRDLGFHRIDRQSNVAVASTVQREMSRRVWWYLVATDWLLAARYGGSCEGVYQTHPLHMTVNKPRNINDVDLIENELQLERPMSQPTDVSYSLQRIRLAEISRSIVDHNLLCATSSSRPSYYPHVMAMDFELDEMMRNIPPFFKLESYERGLDSNTANGIFIQAYMLNSFMHTQRCKLHLAYLTSGPKDNPVYASSRNACLLSARQIIRAECQLLRTQHSFVRVRLRLGAILYSVFMASIVLLMDVCIHVPGSLQDETLQGDIADALHIIDDARGYSLAAAKLHESLMQILAKHRAQPQQPTPQALHTVHQGDGCTTKTTSDPSVHPPSMHKSRPGSLSSVPCPAQEAFHGSIQGNSPNALLDELYATDSLLAEGSENTMNIDDFEWDDLLSGIVSSSFF